MTRKKDNTHIEKTILHKNNRNSIQDNEKTLLKDSPNHPGHNGAKVDFALVKSFWEEKEGKTRKKLTN